MRSRDWQALARTLGPEFGEHADRHDREGSFVEEAFRKFRDEGLFAALVPTELGGQGAGLREICEFIREIARHCPSSALAYSMHTHLVAATVYRHRRGQPGEALLRRVAEGNLVLVSTGAGDWLDSNGEMRRVDGGYRYTSRKPFCSGVPFGDLLITSGRYEDPVAGPMVLHFPLSLDAEGVRVDADWDAHGMRGTGSHTVHLDAVFVADSSIALRRPRGPWHPAFDVIAVVALPIIMSAYVGIADRAVELALESARQRREEPDVQIAVGELISERTVAHAVWDAQIRNADEFDFEATAERTSLAVQAKSVLAEVCPRVVGRAMGVVGGASYFRSAGIERLMRDVRAAPFHPLQARQQVRFSGRVALGLDPVPVSPRPGAESLVPVARV